MAKTTRLFIIGLAVWSMSTPLWAQTDADNDTQTQTSPDPGQQQPQQQAPATHPVATTYSDAYEVRLKIHKYASYATLPLFATELALGQSLYNNPDTGARKGAHAAVGTGLVGCLA